MEHSESIGKLGEALALAQGEIENAKKDSENPFFKSKYADLASVRDACKTALSKNGLAVIQMPKSIISEDATIISLETMILHSSGEWIKGDLGAIPVKTDPQGIGSCITYLRRYALSSVTGVATEDDDGNAASHSSGGQQTARQRPLTQKATEIAALKKSIVDVCQMLNGAGDDPKWTAKRVDEFALTNFGIKADALELDLMRELVKRLSLRLDDLKKKPKTDAPIDDGFAERERKAKLESISKDNEEKAIVEGMKELKFSKAFTDLTLDQAVALDEWLSVPF